MFMRIVNIFGLVVAVHVGVLLLIFAIPGCRSTSTPADRPVVAADEPVVTPAPPTERTSELSAADLNPAVAAASSRSGGRSSPTRPAAVTSAPDISEPPAASLETYTVARGDSLWSIARKHGVTVRELAAANNLSTEARLQIDQKLQIPRKAGSQASTAASSSGSSPDDAVTYTVKAGDTLGAIARRHQTSVAALKAMNGLRSDLLRIGDTLLIPRAAVTSPAPEAARPAPAPQAPTAPAPRGTMKHVIAPGETLGAIARKYDVKLGDLALANSISDPRRIRAGDELTIPGWSAAGDAPASTAATDPPTSSDQRTRAETRPSDDIPVIQVEEPEPTLKIEPAPGRNKNGSGAPVFR